MKPSALHAALALAVAGAGSCAPPDPGRPDLEAAAFLQVVAAENARPAGGPALEILVDATHHARAGLRAAAVRGLGRLERPQVLEHIVPLLYDVDPTVRMEAANAAAQAVHRGSGTDALAPLLARLDHEDVPSVRGAVARSLGRLHLDDPERRRVASTLEGLSHGPNQGFAPEDELEGVALGAEALMRSLRGEPRPPMLQARLRDMAVYGRVRATESATARRIRTVALLAYAGPGLTAQEVETFLADPESAVRRVAAARLGTVSAPKRFALADRALADASAQVRLEAVRSLGLAPLGSDACRRLAHTATQDADTGVRLMALDALSQPCPDGTATAALLERTADALPADADASWHAAAHALVALSALDAGRTAALLPAFATHANPFARTYAAQAATRIGAVAAVRALTADSDANVRAAALTGLAALEGRRADTLLVRVAATDDAPQVLLAVAAALQGTAIRAEALDAAVATVQRLGEARSETLRDPRVALLGLAESVGDAGSAARLEPFLRDFDAAVAERAAQAQQAWTGKRYLAAPRGAGPLPLPSVEDLHAMERGTLVLHMARGGDVQIQLRPREAPTNAYRLYSMVGAGTLDGLTFHRVVPNFVVQGGSPGANEYAGHGAFTRDEVGLDVQWRGTVGVSTRGRDTGDGQIYVNLVDDVRLDHDYTILGVVTAGMDVVDGVLEGDVIRSAEWVPGL